MKLKIDAPDYYSEFSCLAGDCKYDCCHGWNINLSRAEYNKLRNARKSAELQQRAEGGVKRKKGTDEKKYAYFHLDEQGICPMLNDEGLCWLQIECGFKVLPHTCRVFPRVEKVAPDCVERSCSIGCEVVLQLLLDRPDGLRFVESEEGEGAHISLKQEVIQERPALAYYREIHRFCIAILQNRCYSLGDRLFLLGMAMRSFNPAAPNAEVLSWITKEIPPLLGENPALSKSLAALPTDVRQGAANGLRLTTILQRREHRDRLRKEVFEEILRLLGVEVGHFSGHAQVESIEDLDVAHLTETDLNIRYEVGLSFDAERYAEAARHFDSLPFTAHLMENLMVNWLFQNQFPLKFPKAEHTVWHDYLSLCAVYNFFRVAAVGYMADKDSPEDLIRLLTVCSRGLLHVPEQIERNTCEMEENAVDTLAHMAYLLKC